jgi:protein arginine kinase activator
MLCDNCKEREAAVHLQQVKDNSVSSLHLCQQCAAEKGIEAGVGAAKFPLSDFLASMGKGPALPGAKDVSDQACEFCGATLKDFQDTGRLGCPRCYDVFETQLRDLLRRLHGSSHHVGEPYLSAEVGDADEKHAQISDLRNKLRQAIETENFELAAELRDRLRTLE